MRTIKLLSFANLIGFIATFIINWLAISLPINGKTTGELSDMYPNLFVPAGITFSIWSVIYLLLLIFVIWQLVEVWRNSENAKLTEAVGLWFLVSSAANCSWILAWHYELPALSLLIMVILLFSLIKIYVIIRQEINTLTRISEYLVYPAFSIYFGWITVATIANVTAVLVHVGYNGAPFTEQIWTVIMICIATGMGIYFLIFHGNFYYTLVIFWALYGIYLKRSTALEWEEGIILASKIGMAMSIASAFYPLLNKYLRPGQ